MKTNGVMTLTDSLRQELQDERQRLLEHAKLRTLEMRRLMAESRKLSETIEQIERLLKFGQEESEATGEGADKAPPVPGKTTNPALYTPFQQLGFREAIRTVLREAGRGMRPKEVTEELRRRGWQSDEATETNLSTRVSNDLYRMKKSGKVRKKGPRYYAVAKQED